MPTRSFTCNRCDNRTNGISQAKAFKEITKVTEITYQLDGTAKDE